MKTKTERIIYLAGLLEGEGCFIVRKPKNRRNKSIRIHLWMSDEDVVKWAAEIAYGLILRNGAHPEIYIKAPVTGTIKSKKTLYGFTLNGEMAILVMKEILPFMGIRRTAKIKECIKEWGERSRARIDARGTRCSKTRNIFQ